MTTESEIREAHKDAGGHTALVADLKALRRAHRRDKCVIGEEGIDCRLRYHDGSFQFHTGDASYDQDHRGYWGSASVTHDMTDDTLASIADDLLDQVLDHASQDTEV